jgi:hypothetical protein
MSLINPAILYGLGLAAIPVILHFLLRSKPKKLIFPALRLVQIRRKNNVRRMRLRHVWLLLLRILVIALIVLAIARPSLPAANYAPNWRESLTIAGIAAAAAGTYLGTLWSWRRNRVTHHDLVFRKSLLRGATGLVALLLFLLLFAWPYQRRISAEIVAPLPEVARNLPVCGVFVFDTSLSMEYRFENQSRLEVAQEIAEAHISRLPQGSRIAVADTATHDPLLFQADLAGAQSRISALATSPASDKINDKLRAAVALQDEDRRRILGGQESLPQDKRSDRFLREVYVFTDMAETAWQTKGSTLLRDELKRFDWCQIYLIDVSIEKPTNLGISDIALSKQTVPEGSDLVLTADIENLGFDEPTEKAVELYAEDAAGELMKQGQQTVRFEPGSGARATFTAQGLKGPVGRGELRLISSDPYTIDDVRYFTVAVQPPPHILIVSDSADEAVYLKTAVVQPELEEQGRSSYRTTALLSSQLRDADLSKFDIVCLVNVRHPTEDDWVKLASFVNAGGGLAVFLGMRNGSENPVAASYDNPTADALLPARLLADLSFSPEETLDLRNHVHPVLSKVERVRGLAELTSARVSRYWRVEPSSGASVIAEYTDSRQSPALLERPVGRGRTMMLTTAVDLSGWSDIPRTWAFLALTDEMMHYLGGRANDVYNYSAGEEVVLQLPRDMPETRFLLRRPNLQQTPAEIQPGAASFVLPTTDQIGQYRLSPSENASPTELGFCVNPPAAESDFDRIRDDDLNNVLGDGRYSVAKDVESLRTNVTQGRVGKEVFSLVLLIMIGIFCTEHIVANWFYEAEQAVEHR